MISISPVEYGGPTLDEVKHKHVYKPRYETSKLGYK